MKRPEEIFKEGDLPEDLKWIITHFGLPREDPAIVLMVWHWQRVQHAEDVIRKATEQLTSTLDERLKQLRNASIAYENLEKRLAALSALAEDTPKKIQNITRAWNDFLPQLKQIAQPIQRRLLLAAFASGFASASILIPWLIAQR